MSPAPVIVTRGDAADLHLPDESVDLVVTSPPYFGLRSYQDDGEHCAGQVGDEATPTEYLDALIACTAEWMRVLKPGGSIFCNLGDKYAQRDGQGNNGHRGGSIAASESDYHVTGIAHGGREWDNGGVKAKSLIGLPWRYAIRCIDELGLILRAEIVWAKPNGLPESVTDRVRRSHEQVFHFVKQPRYFSAVDEVREAHADDAAKRRALYGANTRGTDTSVQVVHKDGGENGVMGYAANPLGKLPGSVWSIPTAPLRVPEWLNVDHFAAYPPELVRRIVLGWSPREVCTACGEGRRPVADRTPMVWRESPTAAGRNAPGTSRKSASGTMLAAATTTITGYACACPDTTAPATPGVVLDPFGGTGTTALVASCFGRIGISVDLSADYCRLAQWRTTDPGERARVLGVDKPEPVPMGQLGLFEGGAA